MPAIPPGTALDAAARGRLDALIAIFRAATRELLAIEATMRDGTYRRAYLRRQIAEASAVIDRLVLIRDGRATGEVIAWAREHFPATYQSGVRMAARDLRAQDMVPRLGSQRIHGAAVDAVLGRYVDDVTQLVVQLKGNVIRTSRIVLAQAGFGQEIAAGVIGGLPRRETSRLLVRSLRRAVTDALPAGAEADLSGVTINGRRFRLDYWAEMHARTETARASTMGTRTMAAANGVRHVQVTSHAHEPCICTPYEGRIYSLERGDPRFAWIGELPNGGCPMHPNCVHREAPAVIDYLDARNEADGRAVVPRDFRGLSTDELARKVRENRDQLRPWSRDRNKFLPESFRLRGQ